jgi:hypothetical protein
VRWDFWRKRKSLKQLEPHMLAFIMVQKVAEQEFPFNKWREGLEPIPEHADAFVEMAVNVYQLCIFLDFLEKKFGSDVSGVVRSRIIALMCSRGRKYSGIIGQYFEAIQIGRALPEREPLLAGEPSIQIDNNIAKAFLRILSASEEEKKALYVLLGRSLSRGRISAEAAFGGVIEEIEFRPETIIGLCRPEDIPLAWSEACGSFERQLQRRHNNPLFPREKRTVITAELVVARSQDLCDLCQLQGDSKRTLDEFERILDDVTGEANSTTASRESLTMSLGELIKIRDAIENLIIRAAGIGDIARTQRQGLRKVYEAVVGLMRDACPAGHEPELEVALEKSDDLQKTFANHFVAQSRREDTPIYSDGLVASLLVEDVETVRIMASLVPESARMELAKEAFEMIDVARKEGYAVPDAADKLKAFQR